MRSYSILYSLLSVFGQRQGLSRFSLRLKEKSVRSVIVASVGIIRHPSLDIVVSVSLFSFLFQKNNHKAFP